MVIEVIKTCKATLASYGFTASYGYAVVVSRESRQVLDAVILSKQSAKQESPP